MYIYIYKCVQVEKSYILKWYCVGCGSRHAFFPVALVGLEPSAIDWICNKRMLAGRTCLCVSGEVVLCQFTFTLDSWPHQKS